MTVQKNRDSNYRGSNKKHHTGKKETASASFNFLIMAYVFIKRRDAEAEKMIHISFVKITGKI